MKVLVMNCSPVRNGATAEIVNIVSECLKERYEVRSICIDDFDISFCKPIPNILTKLIQFVKIQIEVNKGRCFILPKIKIDKESVIKEAAYMANTIGIENLSLKTLASQLGVKSPSLYNHIDGLDDLKQQLMLYGWKELENKIIQAVIGFSGYDAIRAMCYAFHEYAIENPGVFSTMLWYNQFENEQMSEVTSKMFSIFFKITKSLNISQDNCIHLVRMFRSFLEGFALLENHNAFGNTQLIKDSFELSITILIEGAKKLEGK